MSEARGGLRRLVDRVTRSPDEVDGARLRRQATDSGCVHVREVEPRTVATVEGEVRSVTLRPRSDTPAMVVELWDGSDPVQLVWLGRRRILGVDPGVRLRVTGRVSLHRGRPTIYNPVYTIVARTGGTHG